MGGTVWGLKNDQIWVVVLALITCIGTCLGFCLEANGLRKTAEVSAQDSDRVRKTTEAKLENLSAEILSKITFALDQSSRASASLAMIASLRLIERNKLAVAQWGDGPDLRKFLVDRGKLILAALMPTAAVIHLRVNDPFELIFVTQSGTIHRVAPLRVLQPPDHTIGSVFFEVDRTFDEATFDALYKLAFDYDQVPQLGYKIRCVFDVNTVNIEDIRMANRALRAMTTDFRLPYFKEVAND